MWFDDTTVARLRALLSAYIKEVRRGVDIERALAMALDIESSELEDVVVDLLQVVKDRRWRDQAVQMLIHDLGDLSFMIEKYTRDEGLLARADELVERRVGGCERTRRCRCRRAAGARRAPRSVRPHVAAPFAGAADPSTRMRERAPGAGGRGTAAGAGEGQFVAREAIASPSPSSSRLSIATPRRPANRASDARASLLGAE